MQNTIFFVFVVVFFSLFFSTWAQAPLSKNPFNFANRNTFVHLHQNLANAVKNAQTPFDKRGAKASEITNLRQELKALLQNYTIDSMQDMSIAGKLMRVLPFVPNQNKSIRIPRNDTINEEDRDNEATFELPDDDQLSNLTNAVVSFEDETNSSELDGLLMSPLVGLSFYNESGDEKHIQNLTNKIQIKIPLKRMDDATYNSKRFVCKYFDVATGSFKTDGVTFVSKAKTHVFCNASHLTDFGVFDDNSSFTSTTTLATSNTTSVIVASTDANLNTSAPLLSTTTSAIVATTSANLNTSAPPRYTTTSKSKDCPFLYDCETPNGGLILGPSMAFVVIACVIVLAEINIF